MGGVSVLLINTHPTTTFYAAVDNLPVLDDPKAAEATPRLEFVLTSAADEGGGGGAADPDADADGAGGGAGAAGGGAGAAGGGAGAAGGGAGAAGGGDGDNGGGDGGGGGGGDTVGSEALLRSTRVRLNGALLEVDASGALPKLHSVRMRGPSVVARPLSVAFHIFPEAGVRACMSEKQEAAWQKKERRGQKRAGRGKGKLPKKGAEAKPGDHRKSAPADAADAAGCTGDPEWCQNQRRKAAKVPR